MANVFSYTMRVSLLYDRIQDAEEVGQDVT